MCSESDPKAAKEAARVADRCPTRHMQPQNRTRPIPSGKRILTSRRRSGDRTRDSRLETSTPSRTNTHTDAIGGQYSYKVSSIVEVISTCYLLLGSSASRWVSEREQRRIQVLRPEGGQAEQGRGKTGKPIRRNVNGIGLSRSVFYGLRSKFFNLF